MTRLEEAQTLKARLEKGGKSGPFWICGPCVIESEELVLRVAGHLASLSAQHDIPIVFKASFDKANRTSGSSFRGLGMEKGLEILLKARAESGLPILTDVHECAQAPAGAEVADILHVPAFLCRQTDLLEAVAATGRLVNVKKGQFLDPANVKSIVQKLESFGTSGFWITERGVSFGYQRLIVDFAGFPEMQNSGAHLILDITHSVQLPGAGQGVTGGIREAIPYLARSGAAVGVHGFFAETHPEPSQALSDAANAWPLAQMGNLMQTVARISEAAHG